MKWAILTLTKGALKLGKKIKEIFPEFDLYSLPKWTEEKDIKKIEGKFQYFVSSVFNSYDVLLFIMATGIVVRSIAPCLKNKSEDPAVLVMDEKGNFVISLLSGHLGGANEAALMISKKIGAQAVITTSSDVTDSIAVDTMAEKLNCEIESMEDAKNITSLIVNGYKVGVVSKIDINLKLPDNVIFPLREKDKADGIIYIDNIIRESNKQKVRLIPKNIVIGAGCRKGIGKEYIIETVENVLKELKLHRKSIKHFATADVKKEEEGLIELAKHFGVELKIIKREEIKEVEKQFEISDFVKKQIGVGAVSEPCAYLSSSKKGRFLMKKNKFRGVTLAIWEETI